MRMNEFVIIGKCQLMDMLPDLKHCGARRDACTFEQQCEHCTGMPEKQSNFQCLLISSPSSSFTQSQLTTTAKAPTTKNCRRSHRVFFPTSYILFFLLFCSCFLLLCCVLCFFCSSGDERSRDESVCPILSSCCRES